jgi:hypothetical protein
MAWEGERTVTFTMEDALISPAGFMILSGAGLVEAGELDVNGNAKKIKVHATEQIDSDNITVESEKGEVRITLSQKPYFEEGEDYVYVMMLKNGEVDTEPFIPAAVEDNVVVLQEKWTDAGRTDANHQSRGNDLTPFYNAKKSDLVVLVDYYVERSTGVSEITITPDKFGGYYYLEASTLFRNTDGVDMPAEFIIPNCKIQSNFTFSMASSGDPSTFTFTIDAFPDYTRFDKTKKVLAAIQIVTEAEGSVDLSRVLTKSEDYEDSNGMIGGTRPYAAQA